MAEEYKNDAKPAVTETERTTVVTRKGAENGAAEYPVPERKGFPWWLLLPLLLIPLLFLFNRNRNEETPVATATPAAVASSPAVQDSAAVAVASPGTEGTAASSEQAPEGKDIKVFEGQDIAVAPKEGASAKGEPLTDVIAITGAKDRSTLVGRKVQLKNVNVTRVLNEQAFYVGTSGDAEMLVLLDPRLDAGANGGEKVVIAEGKTVSLTGLLEASPTTDKLSQFKVTPEDAAAIGQQGVYIHATIAQDKSDVAS